MATSRVRGGQKLKRFLKEARESARKQHVIEVGFKDRRIAVLAAQLEFGNPETNLPERPAFRLGMGRMARALSERVLEMKRADARAGRGPVFGLTRKQAEEVAILARNVLRQAYREFHGAPLSERQRLRKAGTEYADEQLIGAEGPKLVGHIKAYVDGVEVG